MATETESPMVMDMEVKSISTKEVERTDSMEKVVTLAATLMDFPEDITACTLVINGKNRKAIDGFLRSVTKSGDLISFQRVSPSQKTLEEAAARQDTPPEDKPKRGRKPKDETHPDQA